VDEDDYGFSVTIASPIDEIQVVSAGMLDLDWCWRCIVAEPYACAPRRIKGCLKCGFHGHFVRLQVSRRR